MKFGTVSATSFTVGSPTSITATSPAGSGTVDVTVTTAGGTSATGAGDQFTYFTKLAPEFGRCIKVTAGQGKFGAGTCIAPGGTKSYEWYPGFAGSQPLLKAHFTTKSTTEPLLETTAALHINCKAETGRGEYSGAKTVAGVVLTLTGCHRGELGACSSAGAGEGEVVTSALGGELGIVKAGLEASKNKLGLSLRPAGEAPLAEFSCGGVPLVVRGAVIEEVKSNAMLLTVTLKYVQSKGVQKPARFEGGPAEVLEVSLNGEPFRQAGLSATTVQTNEEKIEISSVQ